ncbi:MAG: glycosyltransferase family 4 protein, partial [Actinomycetota bacterium]|nr:glycosyltransferase family 4 protein [Actinomycetota bacterium]
MDLLYVLQRYGHDVAGGAERHCREFATRLAAHGHHVEVLTSCAVNHSTWDNAYPEGDSDVDGVLVHRLAVARRRNEAVFAALNNRVLFAPPPALHLQRRWLEEQGPVMPGLAPWLVERASGYDVVVFFTFLFYPTWAGLPAVTGLAPSVLHPTAHDEAALGIPHFDTVFRQPSAFAFSTEEERSLVRRRFGVTQPSAVIGVGVDLEESSDPGATASFRAAHGLSDRPYLVFVGRVEPGKGSRELFDFFAAYKARNPGPLALVILGEVVFPLPEHPDVVLTGYVDDPTRRAALAGGLALVQPSYFESFSMVLSEAWAARKGALVQGHCEVLAGQAIRSGGGLPY